MRNRPIVVGIVNVTPDSFYDGGRHGDGLAQTESLIEAGADWIDVGGESTRPGAQMIDGKPNGIVSDGSSRPSHTAFRSASIPASLLWPPKH